MPIEVHEHFDDNDVRTGYTVITRESAWDDESRARALALAQYESGLCRCGCGLPVEVGQRTDQAFLVDDIVCQAGKALDRVTREAREKHEKDPAWWDGRRHYVTPVDDDRPPEKRGGARGN